MFKRKNNSGSLPTTMSSLNVPSGDNYNNAGGGGGGYGGGFAGLGSGNRQPDGSGRAIKMDAPVVKAWKQSSTFTKYSYYILAVCFFFVIMGYRYLRYSNGSIWLTCHAQECTLELTPPGVRTQTIVFARTQLHSVQATKVDKNGKFLQVDTSKYEPPQRGKNKKKKGYKSGAYKGPDENGMYSSYCIKLHPETPTYVEKTEEDVADGDFTPVLEYLEKDRADEGGHVYVLHMRKFGLAQSRTRIRSMINKVESYMKRRRQKLLVKETAPLPWQGLLFLIFGLLGLMLTLIIGQFWEETPRKQGGPGARRVPKAATNNNSSGSSSSKTKPTFVYDTGRPSKYPPGYNYNKKY